MFSNVVLYKVAFSPEKKHYSHLPVEAFQKGLQRFLVIFIDAQTCISFVYLMFTPAMIPYASGIGTGLVCLRNEKKKMENLIILYCWYCIL